jgi:hypothetical protein
MRMDFNAEPIRNKILEQINALQVALSNLDNGICDFKVTIKSEEGEQVGESKVSLAEAFGKAAFTGMIFGKLAGSTVTSEIEVNGFRHVIEEKNGII